MMMVVCSDVLDILKRPSCESINMTKGRLVAYSLFLIAYAIFLALISHNLDFKLNIFLQESNVIYYYWYTCYLVVIINVVL